MGAAKLIRKGFAALAALRVAYLPAEVSAEIAALAAAEAHCHGGTALAPVASAAPADPGGTALRWEIAAFGSFAVADYCRSAALESGACGCKWTTLAAPELQFGPPEPAKTY